MGANIMGDFVCCLSGKLTKSFVACSLDQPPAPQAIAVSHTTTSATHLPVIETNTTPHRHIAPPHRGASTGSLASFASSSSGALMLPPGPQQSPSCPPNNTPENTTPPITTPATAHQSLCLPGFCKHDIIIQRPRHIVVVKHQVDIFPTTTAELTTTAPASH
jgi:hypothetical protein